MGELSDSGRNYYRNKCFDLEKQLETERQKVAVLKDVVKDILESMTDINEIDSEITQALARIAELDKGAQ